jgi:hypothetical protein
MNDGIEEIGGIAVRSERIEFDQSELVTCERCGRANAPNRAECMYCGAVLAIAVASAELKLRDVEPWEKAFNVVLLGGQLHEGSSGRLPIDTELLSRATALGPPFPVARIAGSDAAAVIQTTLKELGIDAIIVSDEELHAERVPIRLRSIDIEVGRLRLTSFNTHQRMEFAAEALDLIVIGRLFEERAEQTLKKKRKVVKELDARSVSRDAGVIDLYFSGDPNSFRVMESGFDFGCLGERKGILASENLRTLVDILKAIAPSTAVSSDYVAKRGLLEEIWPSEVRNDSKGIQRARFGISVSKAEVTSNAEQFTKYSRLVRQIL